MSSGPSITHAPICSSWSGAGLPRSTSAGSATSRSPSSWREPGRLPEGALVRDSPGGEPQARDLSLPALWRPPSRPQRAHADHAGGRQLASTPRSLRLRTGRPQAGPTAAARGRRASSSQPAVSLISSGVGSNGMALKKVGLVTASALCSINLWTGAPLFAVWVGSKVQGNLNNLSMTAVFSVILILAVTVFALGFVLTWLNAKYDELTGRPAV